MNLVTIQTKQSLDFKENLKKLVRTIKKIPENSLTLACELALTGYSYDKLEEASHFYDIALKKLLNLSKNKAIALTLTLKKDGKYYNTFHFLHNKEILHTQSKVELFKLNYEDRHFTSGDEKDIKIFEFQGIKIGALICFELRFINYWQKLKGADIILIPAMWGTKRKKHFEQLSQALAVANQCFVVTSNSKNFDCARSSAIISPFGEVLQNDKKRVISKNCDLNKIEKMRKYLPTGVN